MNKKLLLFSCLGWLACSPALLADPPVANPLVALPQGDFSCTVDVTPHDIPKPDPAHPGRTYAPVLKKILITKIGNIRRDYIVMSDNSFSQLWSLTDTGLTVQEMAHGDKKNVYVIKGLARDKASPKLLHFDEDSVSWITEKALVKGSAGNAGGTLHYQARVAAEAAPQTSDSGPGSGAIALPSVMATYQAWIDSKTLRPMKFDDGDTLYVLTFSPTPPVGPLVMPDNLQAKLKRWQAALAPRQRL